MKLRIFTSIVLALAIASSARPSLSQPQTKPAAKPEVKVNLNAQLKESLCVQDWGRSIQILDRMKVAAPESAAEIATYRQQIEGLQRSGAKIPNWPPTCVTAKTESTTSASPNAQAGMAQTSKKK
jgi:hypothetical protein